MADSMPTLHDLPNNVYAQVCRNLTPVDLAQLEQSSPTLRRQTRDHGWQADHYQHPHNILHRPLDRYMPPPYAWKALVRERHWACLQATTFRCCMELSSMWVAGLQPIDGNIRRDGVRVYGSRAAQLRRAGHAEAAASLEAVVHRQKKLEEACALMDPSAIRAAIAAGACTTFAAFGQACLGRHYSAIRALCAGIGGAEDWLLPPDDGVGEKSALRVQLHETYRSKVSFFQSFCLMLNDGLTPPAQAAHCLSVALQEGLPRRAIDAIYHQTIVWRWDNAYYTRHIDNPQARAQAVSMSSLVARLAVLRAAAPPPQGSDNPLRVLGGVVDSHFHAPYGQKVRFGSSRTYYRPGDIPLLVNSLIAMGCPVDEPVYGDLNALEHLLHRRGHRPFTNSPAQTHLTLEQASDLQIKLLVDSLIDHGSRQVDFARLPQVSPDERAYIEAAQAAKRSRLL